MNQGYYSTTYGYDGADQLTSEASTGSYPPPALGYTYDHNGNRLTQTKNGTQVQSFTYDSHDKMTSGTAGSETDGYDKNGNETSISISGGLYRFTYDDEDRLTSLTTPGGITDTFTYNGLGLRVGKTDSTGTYSYFCDGATPGSDVLSDGHAVYTPGESENRGGASSFYSNDRLGNLWTLDGTTKNQLTYIDFTGFGTPVSGALGSTSFGYGGGNGCLTDADIGLVLMGHRYYDTRIGRFITQDPAGAGDNWYAYAGNSPVNGIDPTGLVPLWPGMSDDTGQIPGFQGQPTGYWPDGSPYFVPNGGPESDANEGDPSSWAYDLNSYGYTGPNGPSSEGGSSSGDVTGPSAGEEVVEGFGVGISAVGNQFSFGFWDGGSAKRDPSFGVSSGLAMAGTMLIPVGGEAKGAEVAADLGRPLAGLADKELQNIVSGNNKLLSQLWGSGIAGAEKALAEGPRLPEGLKKEVLEAYREIGLRAIEGGRNSTGIHNLRVPIVEKVLQGL